MMDQTDRDFNPNNYYKDMEALNELITKYGIIPYQFLKITLDEAMQRNIDTAEIWLTFAGKFTDLHFSTGTEKVNYRAITLAVEYIVKMLQNKSSPKQVLLLFDKFEYLYRDTIINQMV